MKKATKRFLSLIVCLSLMTLLIPSYSSALESMKLGDESELRLYGFIRNSTGMFTEKHHHPFAENGNDLAIERTQFRAYIDYILSQQLRIFSAIQFSYEPEYRMEKNALTSRRYTDFYKGQLIREAGKEYSEYDNLNDVLREFAVVWTPNSSNTIKIGRQIAIWGESMSMQIGDVVHPNNNRYGMAYTNWEDARIPSWMVRGIHDIGFLNSSFEWIISPNLVKKEYRVNYDNATGQRWGAHPEDRPEPIGLYADLIPENLAFLGEVSPDIKYPGVWKDMRYGFRTTTTLAGFTFGGMYFHTQTYYKQPKFSNYRIGATGGYPFLPPFIKVGWLSLVYPTIDIFGVYANKSFAPFPGAFRTEATWTPNMTMNVLDSDVQDLKKRDNFKFLLAYDLRDYLYFNWHKDAAFNVGIEFTGDWMPARHGAQWVTWYTKMPKVIAGVGMPIDTTWYYGMFTTSILPVYQPWGKCGFINSSVSYKPPILNEQLSFAVSYNMIYGKSDYNGIFGGIKRQDTLQLTTQYNW